MTQQPSTNIDINTNFISGNDLNQNSNSKNLEIPSKPLNQQYQTKENKKGEPPLKSIIKELEKEAEPCSFFELFRYASKKDKIYIVLGSLAAAINGAALPAFSILFGNVSDAFVPGGDSGDLLRRVGIISAEFLGLGIASFILSYISFATWMTAGEHQTIKIRKKYFQALLRQEIAFFDSVNPNEISSKIADECFQIQAGIGETVSTFIYSIAMLISGFIIGYIFGWQLALVLTSVTPLLAITGTAFVYSVQKQTEFTSKSYTEAGAISEEALNGVKTITSLNGQEKELKRYQVALDKHNKSVVKFGAFSGAAMGLVWFTLFGMYALGFWYGAKLIDDGTTNAIRGRPYNGGDTLIVFFSIMFAGFSISQATPAFKKFAKAKSAGGRTFQVIDRKSNISIEDDSGLKPDSLNGEIEFDNVKFAYPLKPDKLILDGISFKAKKNEKIAFVGESGCGKTTCVQLIERFYDIHEGYIKIDGNELKKLNLRWLRQNIGYVGQEPVLFATSIKENLLIAKEDASEEEVWDSLKKANAAEFVDQLPDKLETFVGTNATQLSGGQKQRLAIARAILKNPSILLLDEATSALDRKNEIEIQKTLDEIAEGRTTITIAHRLTTVQNADRIIVFDQGKIVEEGSHKELVSKKGKYYSLQSLQLKIQEEQEKDNNLERNDSDESKKNKSSGNSNQNQEGALTPEIDSKTKNSEVPSTSLDPKNIRGKTKKENIGRQDIDISLEIETNKDVQDQEKDKKSTKKKEKKENITGRLLEYNKEKRGLLILGLIFSALAGICFPISAIIISDYLEIFASVGDPDFMSDATRNAIFYIIIAIASFVFATLQFATLNLVGENLCKKLRIAVLKRYLYNDIGWFDLPENAPGVLIARLSTETNLVNSLASTALGVFAQATASFISGTVIAFIASWQVTLVSLVLSPLVVISGAIQAKLNEGFSEKTDVAYRESINFIAEAANNMRTVASFGREDKLLKNYDQKLEKPMNLAVRKGNLSGLAYGFSQFAMFLDYAVVFFLGAVFMNATNLGYKDLFQSIFGVLFAAFGAGNAMQYAPDVGAARVAAKSIFKILDSQPKIKIDDPQQNCKQPIQGEIEFKDVWFRYPTRPKYILKGLSFKINSSSKVAFVGPSGCGKSTIMSLLLRFYDIDKGEILIDGVELKKYDLRYLRYHFGVVSQEPVLFNGTIEFNIK